MLKNKTIDELNNFEKTINIEYLQFDPIELLIEYKTSLQYGEITSNYGLY